MTKAGDWLFFAASLGGLAAAMVAYLWDESGVSRTAGALLAGLGSLALCLAALIYLMSDALPGWVRGVLAVLVVLAILGTGFAGYLLMQPWIVVAMAVALVGVIVHHIGHRRVPA